MTYTKLGLKCALMDAKSNLETYTAQEAFNLPEREMERVKECKAFWAKRVEELKKEKTQEF